MFAWTWTTYATVVAAGTPGWTILGESPNPWLWAFALVVAGVALAVEVRGRATEVWEQIRSLCAKKPTRKSSKRLS